MLDGSVLACEKILKKQTHQEKKRCPILSDFSSAVPQVMLSMVRKVSVNTAYDDADFKTEEMSWIQRILIYFIRSWRRKQYIKRGESASV